MPPLYAAAGANGGSGRQRLCPRITRDEFDSTNANATSWFVTAPMGPARSPKGLTHQAALFAHAVSSTAQAARLLSALRPQRSTALIFAGVISRSHRVRHIVFPAKRPLRAQCRRSNRRRRHLKLLGPFGSPPSASEPVKRATPQWTASCHPTISGRRAGDRLQGTAAWCPTQMPAHGRAWALRTQFAATQRVAHRRHR